MANGFITLGVPISPPSLIYIGDTMFKNCNTTKQQGNVAVGYAIAYYLREGYTISLPLNDSQKYDLVIEKNKVFYTVQVKSTKYKRNGNYVVELKTSGGTAGQITSHFNTDNFIDYLFVLTEEGTMYNIPCDTFDNKGTLSLYAKFSGNCVNG